jgi:hypothetical protein
LALPTGERSNRVACNAPSGSGIVRAYGYIRLHNFDLYVDQGLWGQPVDVLIYDDAVRVEQANRLLVSYPCVYDTGQRRITSIDARGRQQYRQFQML